MLQKGNFYIVVFIFLTVIWGCQQGAKKQTTSTPDSTITITGQVKNATDTIVRLRFGPFTRWDRYRLKLDTNNYFTKTLAFPRPHYFNLYYDDYYIPLFAFPGDSIRLTFNTDSFYATLQFEGDGGSRNAYLAQKYTLLKDTLNFSIRHALKAKLPVFKRKIDSLQQTYQKHLSSWFSLDSAFKAIEKAEIRFDIATKKMMFENWHPRFNNLDSFAVPEGYYDFIDDFNLNDPINTAFTSYNSFVRSYFNHLKEQRVEYDSSVLDTPAIKLQAQFIKENIKQDTLRDLLLGQLLYRQLRYNGIEHTKPLIADLKKFATLRSSILDSIQNRYNQWKKIAKGKPAPGFSYPNIEGDTLSLKDLRGQYVYIDVWATWCGPCRKEIPHLKKLEKKLHDENIAFVSISVDKNKDKDKWKSMVKEKNLGGHQLFANGNAFDSEIIKDYYINGIPRFILIDPEGNIIDSNAERPSGKIQERLEKLLSDNKGDAGGDEAATTS